MGAVPAVGPEGVVYVVYDSNANNATSYINVAMSKNSGNSFPFKYTGEGFPSLFNSMVGHLRVTSLPTIAVDPNNGEVYVAWAQNDGGSQGMDIYFMHTTAAGEITSWTTPEIATQTTTGNQFFPWLTINSTGHISLVYYQENSNGDVDVYSAQSYDGQSFVGQNGTGQDVKLTSVSSNPAVGATNKASDYIGVASDGSGEVHALWTDFRSGTNQDIYSANYNQQPTVTLTGPTYIDAGGSGAYFLINGSQSSQIQIDLGSSVSVQAVPQNNNWAFAGWSDASRTNPQTITPSDNVSLSANIKDLQHSMDASALSYNSQRKLARESTGLLDEVYSDGGRIWLEESSDGGSTWQLANNGPLDDGSGTASNPSIAVADDIYIVWQEVSGSSKYLYIESPTLISTPAILDTDVSSFDIQPSVAVSDDGAVLVVYRKSDGLGNPNKLYYTYAGNGSTFSAGQQVFVNTPAPYDYPSTAWNESKSRFVLSGSSNSSGLSIGLWTFNGTNWDSTYSVYSSPTSPQTTPYSQVAVDGDGRAQISWIGYDNYYGENSAAMQRSYLNGDWSAVNIFRDDILSQPIMFTSVAGHDDADGGVSVVYGRSPGGDGQVIYDVYSTDGTDFIGAYWLSPSAPVYNPNLEEQVSPQQVQFISAKGSSSPYGL